MVSLSSIKSQVRRRPSLWFGRYSRCLSLEVKDIWLLRYRDHAELDSHIEYRKRWTQNFARWKDFNVQNQEDLHHILDWVLANNDQFKITVGGDHMHLYCDNDSIFSDALNLPGVRSATMTHLELRGQPNTISLAKSQYQQRTYLRYLKITENQKVSLREMLRVQQNIRLSNSLRDFLEKSDRHYVCEYYFVDYNDPGILTMLSLINPGLIRKTLPITTYK